MALAICQTYFHILNDIDRVRLPHLQPVSREMALKPPAAVLPPRQRVYERIPTILLSSAKRAIILSILNLAIYAMGVRQYAWAWSLSFARLAWNVSRYSEPPTWPPYHYTLLVRSIISAMMLVLLWDLSNAAFDTYLAQQPLKKGKPLTDGSKDPNGRLIDGLNSRKELVRVRPQISFHAQILIVLDICILGAPHNFFGLRRAEERYFCGY